MIRYKKFTMSHPKNKHITKPHYPRFLKSFKYEKKTAIKDDVSRAGELAQWLTRLAAPAEDWSLAPAPTSGGGALLLTRPLQPQQTSSPTPTEACTPTHTEKKKKRNVLKGYPVT